MLLLPRRDPDAFLHAGALPISAGRFPLRSGCGRRTGGAAGRKPEFELADTGIFADDRYFDVFVEYAKAAPNDLLIAITAVNRGPEQADLAPASHAVVPQHVDLGLHARGLLDQAADSAGARTTRSLTEHVTLGPLPISRPTGPRTGPDTPVALHRQRNQHASGSTARPTRRPMSKTPFTVTSSKARRRPSIRDHSAPKRRRTTASRSPPGPRSQFRLRLCARGRIAGASLSATAFGSLVAGAERRSATSSTPSSSRPSWVREERHRRPAGLRGPALVKQFYHYVVRGLARRRSQPAAAARVAQARAQRAIGPTCSIATSSPCPTNGSIPGTRRGTWRFT